MPTVHLIAGPHGAGKSTLYRHLIAPRYPALPLVDAHGHAAAELAAVTDAVKRAREAREWADERQQALLREGESFVTETAFSHPSRIALIAQARSMGFEVVLYAMGLDEPRALLERAGARQRADGQAVAAHQVLERYARCMENFRQAVFHADLAFLIDASDANAGGPRLMATVAARRVHLHVPLRPRWVDRALGFSEK